MLTLRHFTVIPRLPPTLERLRDLAYNLWWSWAPVGQDLFIRLDRDLWEAVHGNPIELLARIDQERLNELAGDDAFTSHLEAAWQTFQRYMQREGWFSRTFPDAAGARIAYFSMEYGIHECLPIYSGGLGVLAGDHLKTSSDLGPPPRRCRPRVRGGVLPAGPQHGRLAGRALPDQRLAPHAGLPRARRERQAPHHPRDVSRMGSCTRSSGRCRSVACRCYLLDSNLAENAAGDRSITGPLYGGDQEFRVRQEIMLGIGGVHALEALGLSPTVCHMNEGHSAFLALERIGRVMRERGVPFARRGRGQQPGERLHDAHARPRRQRRVRARPRRAATSSPTARRSGISETELLGLGRDRPARPGRAVLDARPRDPHVGPLQRRQRAPRRGLAQDVAGPLARAADARGPDRVDHQRRAHRLMGRVGDGRALHALPRPALGRAAATTPSSGREPPRFPTPSCGRCTSTAATAWCSTRADGSTRRQSGAAPVAKTWSWPTRCSIRTR